MEQRIRNTARGASLVEISIVLSMVGFLVVLGVPSLLAWRQSQAVSNAASEVSNAMMWARTKSIVERRNYTVQFNLATNTYAILAAGGGVARPVGQPWKDVDLYRDTSDATCPPFTGNRVVFRPNSTADNTGAAAIYLRNTAVGRRYRVRVLGVTGKISTERWGGGSWESVF
jgi:Tfp pilus assembly protein FimT